MLESRLNRILSNADATSIPRVILLEIDVRELVVGLSDALRRKLWHSTCTARCIVSLDFAECQSTLVHQGVQRSRTTNEKIIDILHIPRVHLPTDSSLSGR